MRPNKLYNTPLPFSEVGNIKSLVLLLAIRSAVNSCQAIDLSPNYDCFCAFVETVSANGRPSKKSVKVHFTKSLQQQKNTVKMLINIILFQLAKRGNPITRKSMSFIFRFL